MVTKGRTKIFLLSTLAAAFNQVVMIVCGFVLPRIMLLYFGSELNGLVTSITQFISYFSLVEAGLAGAAVFALYRPLATKNSQEINGVISATKKFYIQSGLIFTTLVIALALSYPVLIKTSSLSSMQVAILVFLIGFRGSLEFFTMAKYRVLLTADQKIYVISVVTSLSNILNTMLVAGLAYFKFDIIVVASGSLVAFWVRPLLFRWYCKRQFPFLDFTQKPNFIALSKRWAAFYMQILSSIQDGLPIILATVFLNLKMVSIFSIFNLIISGVQGVLRVFISGLASSFGDVIVKNEMIVLQKSVQDFEYVFYSIMAIVYSVTFVTIMPFIRLFTKGITDVCYDLPLFGFFIVLNSYLYNLKAPQGMLVISAGLFKETNLQVTIQALIIVLGGVISAPIWGLSGIILAVCFSNFYRLIDLLIFIPKHVTKMPVGDSVMRILWSFMTLVIVVLPTYYIAFSPQTWKAWILMASVATFWATSCIFASSLIFQKKCLKSVVCRIKTILKK